MKAADNGFADSETPDAGLSIDRRTLLSGAALATAALAMGAGSEAKAQANPPAKARPRGRIDVHHHYLGEQYVRTIGRERIAAQSASGNAAVLFPRFA
jgi:hypothetical protein